MTRARSTIHPRVAAAKLFMAFLLSKDFQAYSPFSSIRDDMPAPQGYRALSQYTNTDHNDFHKFLKDCSGAERLRVQLERYIGTPQGVSPLEDVI